jgi:hypothetical protein
MKNIKPNEGKTDRIIRAILSLASLIIAFFVTGPFQIPVQIVLFVVAAAMGITSLTGFCFLYKLFGINTCPVKK